MAARRRRRKHKTQPPPLSAREIRFCQLWVESGNGTRSYIAAGFPHKSENVAAQLARRLFRKVQIRGYIRELQGAAADAAKATVEVIAQGLYRDGWADRRKLFGADGKMLAPHLWPDDVAATVTGVEVDNIEETRTVKGKRKKVTVGYKWKVRTTDRLKARQVLAQWKRMVGQDKADAGKVKPDPLVVGGEADPGNLS